MIRLGRNKKDVMHGIFFRMTRDGRILYLNRYGRQYLGLGDPASDGANLSVFFPSQRAWDRFIKEIDTQGEVGGLELEWRRGDGKKTFVNIFACLEEVEGASYISGHICDLEGINRLLPVLKNSRDKFRNIFDAIPDLILGIDREYKIVSANRAAARWLGKDVKDVIGLSCSELFARETTCPRMSGDKCPAEIAFKSGRMFNTDVLLKDSEGRIRWFSAHAFPVLDDNEETRQVTLFLRDITSQKEAERQVTLLNQELKQTLADLTEKNSRLNAALNSLKETQAHLLQSEKMSSIGQLAAGVAHEINNPVGFVSSNLHTLLSYSKDLVEIIRLYLSLDEKISKAQGVPEDAIALIATIKRRREEIDLDFLLKDMNDLILQSIEGTERVKKIVADLKDFSHVDQAELKDVDINRCLESTITIVWNEIKYKAVLKKNYGELPTIIGYPQQLNQVFMNILVNAAQAIKGKGEITVTTRAVDKPRRGVEVEIKDTGEGIPEDVMPRIFDPFFTTKSVGKGTGLGLHVSYKIVKRHKGEIRVESTPGKGSIFTVFLPILNEDELGDAEEDDARPHPHS
ncbi:MAG: ATP-binding protein [Dissulfurimicrobium hydrothermale]|uniref:ATP-binding protein n=2 Tax=Dissulfurimicrobium hydrothermale TaxID=1750598 RepID=UPI003C75D7BC